MAPGLAITIGNTIVSYEVSRDTLAPNNLEYMDGSNILFVDGSFMLQVE